MSEQPDEMDDAETADFLALARRAIAATDPVPDDVQMLAKMAFDFREIETIEMSETAELAGVRSGSAASSLQVTKDDATLIWSIADDHIIGVVHGDDVDRLQMQTLSGSTDIDVMTDDGSFQAQVPDSAYRLVVTAAGSTWATPWN